MANPKDTAELYLQYNFTQEEILEISRDLAKGNKELEEIKGSKKAVTKEFDSKIANVESKIQLNSNRISNGCETRLTKCEIRFHEPERYKKTTVRLDTYDIVSVEDMTSNEINLFTQPEDEFNDANKKRVRKVKRGVL